MQRAATITFLFTLMVCVLRAGGAAPPANEEESVKNLKQEKLKVVEEWSRLAQEREKAGIDGDDEAFKVAAALRDAQIDLAESKQQRIQALESYRDRMKEICDVTNARFKAGRQGGEAVRVAEARVRLLEARIRLKEEEAK